MKKIRYYLGQITNLSNNTSENIEVIKKEKAISATFSEIEELFGKRRIATIYNKIFKLTPNIYDITRWDISTFKKNEASIPDFICWVNMQLQNLRNSKK